MKADVLEDKKTRESREDFVQDGRLGDISSDRFHDLMHLTSSVIKNTSNLRLSLAGMMPWSIKAMKWQSRVSHPWRCASQHLPVAYYTPAQLQRAKHKGPTFSYNFFLGASERRARRRILIRQQKTDIRQVQPFLAPKGDRNQVKAEYGFWPRRIVRLSVRLPILGGRRTLYRGGVLIGEAFATRYSHLCFFLVSSF